MEQQVDLSLFFEYPDEDDEADDAKDEHYEFYEADVDEDNLFARPWQRILIKHDRERTVRISLQWKYVIYCVVEQAVDAIILY